MNSQEIKSLIRSWVKSDGRVQSELGEIQVGSSVGEGGNALVYECRFADRSAIKFLAEDTSKQPDRYQRFLSEYRNIVKLVPTGVIVPLYHFGVQRINELSIPYIVMGFCESTLENRYKKDRLQDEKDFVVLFERLLEILQVIHSAGIVHRDIKPSNILLGSNGQWLLSDFGIAWFDPEQHERLGQTRNGDRLANFEFSAPEQIRRDLYDNAEPCMDLYALGQTLYWCVTGQTIKGTGHTKLGEAVASMGIYDGIVDKLVKQKPGDRFQSVKEVRDAVRLVQHPPEESEDDVWHQWQRAWQQCREFDRRLRQAMPGSRGYVRVSTREEMDRVMSAIGENCGFYMLYWIRGQGDFSVNTIQQSPDGTWLVGYEEKEEGKRLTLARWECDINEIWIYRDSQLERQYVLLKLDPHLPVIKKSPISELPMEIRFEELGYYQGHYIAPEELDDGFANIDGQIVQLKDPEIRFRNLSVDFIWLAPQMSMYLDEAREVLSKTYETLAESGNVSTPQLEPLKHVRREKWRRVYD